MNERVNDNVHVPLAYIYFTSSIGCRVLLFVHSTLLTSNLFSAIMMITGTAKYGCEAGI